MFILPIKYTQVNEQIVKIQLQIYIFNILKMVIFLSLSSNLILVGKKTFSFSYNHNGNILRLVSSSN